MDMRFIYQSRKYRGNVFLRVFRLEPDLARSLFTSLEAPNPTFTHHQQDCRIKNTATMAQIPIQTIHRDPQLL